MISTGIIRSIDNLGRIVLPKELRSSFGITPDTPLEIFTEADTILLRKYTPAGACSFCGEVSHGAVLFKGKPVCPACRKALREL
ncbi:MAG: AbrB/MazE/SpoVT family DNA-binding domain-containing protein [Gemmiger sp.]